MPEESEQKVVARANLKVIDAVADWVRDEQYRVRKATGNEPTQSQVIEMLILECQRSRAQKVVPLVRDKHGKLEVPERHIHAIEAFLAWLDHKPESSMATHVRTFILQQLGLSNDPAVPLPKDHRKVGNGGATP